MPLKFLGSLKVFGGVSFVFASNFLMKSLVTALFFLNFVILPA